MGRIKKNRLIQMAPHFSGFKPQGVQSKIGEPVLISYEEYEALKLCDYELLTQAEAAKIMNISRPTFTRIYESVRRKLAKAFIEASPISFESGNADIALWYKCEACSVTFSAVEKSLCVCPLCKKDSIILNA